MFRSEVTLQDAVIAVTIVECSMQVLYSCTHAGLGVRVGGRYDRLGDLYMVAASFGADRGRG